MNLSKNLENVIKVSPLLLLLEDAADDVPAVVEVDEAGGAQLGRPLLARRHRRGVLAEGLLVVVVPAKQGD